VVLPQRLVSLGVAVASEDVVDRHVQTLAVPLDVLDQVGHLAGLGGRLAWPPPADGSVAREVAGLQSSSPWVGSMALAGQTVDPEPTAVLGRNVAIGA